MGILIFMVGAKHVLLLCFHEMITFEQHMLRPYVWLQTKYLKA
ncbi:MAG: hypothetical protein HCAMLNBO_02585 [Candidatus Brocadia fulgida]|nr:hypothetical protein [Candidatus Brocadia fulgida]